MIVLLQLSQDMKLTGGKVVANSVRALAVLPYQRHLVPFKKDHVG